MTRGRYVWKREEREGEGTVHINCESIRPDGMCVWTVKPVKRRHARLSVKLETTEAQLTTKSLIVRTSVHSHSRGIAGDGSGVKERLRPTLLHDSAAILINNNTVLNSTAVKHSALHCCCFKGCHKLSSGKINIQVVLENFLSLAKKSFKVNLKTCKILVCCRQKSTVKCKVIEMHFNLLHWTVPWTVITRYQVAPDHLGEEKHSLWCSDSSWLKFFAWPDLKRNGCTAHSPGKECHNNNNATCIIWQFITIKTSHHGKASKYT